MSDVTVSTDSCLCCGQAAKDYGTHLRFDHNCSEEVVSRQLAKIMQSRGFQTPNLVENEEEPDDHDEMYGDNESEGNSSQGRTDAAAVSCEYDEETTNKLLSYNLLDELFKEGEPLTCQVCCGIIQPATKIGLQAHVVSCHGVNAVQYFNLFCTSVLGQHLQKNACVYHCDFCESFSTCSYRQFDAHLNDDHGKSVSDAEELLWSRGESRLTVVSVLTCPVCGDSVVHSPTAIRDHARSHRLSDVELLDRFKGMLMPKYSSDSKVTRKKEKPSRPSPYPPQPPPGKIRSAVNSTPSESSVGDTSRDMASGENSDDGRMPDMDKVVDPARRRNNKVSISEVEKAKTTLLERFNRNDPVSVCLLYALDEVKYLRYKLKEIKRTNDRLESQKCNPRFTSALDFTEEDPKLSVLFGNNALRDVSIEDFLPLDSDPEMDVFVSDVRLTETAKRFLLWKYPVGSQCWAANVTKAMISEEYLREHSLKKSSLVGRPACHQGIIRFIEDLAKEACTSDKQLRQMDVEYRMKRVFENRKRVEMKKKIFKKHSLLDYFPALVGHTSDTHHLGSPTKQENLMYDDAAAAVYPDMYMTANEEALKA